MTSTSEWNLDRLFLGLTIIILGLMILQINPQSDTWWLLRAGQDFWQQGTIQTVETYSFTAYGLKWPNHEWLSQALMYALYSLGGIVLIKLVMGVVLLATWYGVYRLCEGPNHVRAIAILISVVVNSMSWSLRPQVFSLGFTVLLLILARHQRWHWWIPALMLVWVNAHGGFLIGFMLLGAAVGAALIRNRDQVVHWLVISFVSALMSLINPHGYKIWAYTLRYGNYPLKDYLVEWQAPSLLQASGWMYVFCVLILGISLWVTRRDWHSHSMWMLVLSAIGFSLLAFSTVRHMTILTLVIAPIMTWPFRDRAAFPVVPLKQGLLNQVLLVLIASLLAFVFLYTGRFNVTKPNPVMLAALDDCSGPLYNTFNLGGELIWFKRDRPVFVDNRNDPYPMDFIKQALLVEDTGAYQALFSTYQVTCAIVSRESALQHALVHDQWEIIYQDTMYTILADS